jgi:transcription antitermination factor NusG
MEKQEENRWCVVYTRPNAEKRICSELSKMSIKTYLPIQKVIKFDKEVEVPLFPNYLFVNIKPHQSWSVLNVVGIVKYLQENQKPIEISEKEIEKVKANELMQVELFESNKKSSSGNLIKVDFGALVENNNNANQEKNITQIVPMQAANANWNTQFQEA